MTEWRPRIIFWETTKQCNLRCAYCRVLKHGFTRTGNGFTRMGNRLGLELTTQEALELVNNIKKDFGNTLLILSGGEPFLRKDLFDILAHTNSVGLKTALATNGTLLGKKEAIKLKEFGVSRVSISLDSSQETYHDISRGIAGSYRKAISCASILKSQGIPLQINFTVTKSNRREIVAIAEHSHSLGVVALHYFVLVAVGCGMELEKSEMLNAEDMDEVLRTIKRVAQDLPIEIRPTCAPQYARFREGGCLAGNGVFFISSAGDIYPCGYLPVNAGSIREQSIGDIWRNSPVFTRLRQNRLKGACSSCSYKDRCRGCRARAYSKTGDYMDEDPSCSMSRELAAT